MSDEPKPKMRFFEVDITARKMVCVEAEDEEDAMTIARDNVGIGWEPDDEQISDELDPSNPKEAQWIEEYKQDHEFYSDEYP